MVALTGNKVGHIGSLTSGGAMVATLLVLSGCGHDIYYHKDNVPTQQAYQDLYECKQASMRNYSAGSLSSTPKVAMSGMYASGSHPDTGMTNLCMQGRGYTISDTPQSALGSYCVASNVTIGTRMRKPDGSMAKVTALYGTSPRCSDPAIPMAIDLEEVGEGESSVTASQGCAPSTVTIGTRLTYPNGKMVKVTALYGNSPRCPDPGTPFFVDVQDVDEREESVTASQGSHCAASNATIGTRLTIPGGKMVKVATLYGNSPRCQDPATPILVDVQEMGE